MNVNYLVIEGNIGVGKTSLVTKLAEEYNAKPVFEQFADNPFLAKFYEDQDKYAFPLEMAFLAERYNQLNKDLQSRDLFSSFTIADYYFMKSLIFAGVTLKDDEYQLYRQFFEIIYSRLPKPDLFVYLYANLDRLKENIIKRGRNFEANISMEYLSNLNKGYFQFMKQQNDFPSLVLDVSNVDFINKENDYERVKEIITQKSYTLGITRVIL